MKSKKFKVLPDTKPKTIINFMHFELEYAKKMFFDASFNPGLRGRQTKYSEPMKSFILEGIGLILTYVIEICSQLLKRPLIMIFSIYISSNSFWSHQKYVL